MSGRPVASIGRRLLFLRRPLFGGVEQVLKAAPDVCAGPVIGRLACQAGHREGRDHAEQEQRVLGPGEHKKHSEGDAYDTAEREVFRALVGDVGG